MSATGQFGPISLRWNLVSPLPDETLHSWVCGLRASSMRATRREAVNQLAHVRTLVIESGLPTHLQDIWSLIGSSFFETATSFCEAMTDYPYYSAFLPADRAERLMARMLVSNGGLKTELGLVAGRVGAEIRLRWCTRCAHEDLARHGRTYWRRAHSLPGVAVCHIHGIRLSKVSTRSVGSDLLPPTMEAQEKTSIGVVTSSEKAAKFAGLSAAALHGGLGLPKATELRDQYLALLAQAGYTRGTRQVRTSDVLDSIPKFWGRCFPLDPKLNRLLLDGSESWVPRLYRRPRAFQHPVFHLLLLGWLQSATQQRSADDQFERPKPPREVRWADLATERQRQVRERWGTQSARSIARDLRLDIQTVLGVAEKMGLPVARRPKRMRNDTRDAILQAARSGATPLEISRLTDLSLSSVYRVLRVDANVLRENRQRTSASAGERHVAALKRFIASSPCAGVKSFRLALPATYAWLYRHQRHLLASSFRRLPVVPPKQRRDWSSLDRDLSRRIALAAQSLEQERGRPIRITKKQLADMVGMPTLEKRIHRLPMTAEVLKQCAESRLDYQKRRLSWAIDDLWRLSLPISRSRALRHANINFKFWPELYAEYARLMTCLTKKVSVHGKRVA